MPSYPCRHFTQNTGVCFARFQKPSFQKHRPPGRDSGHSQELHPTVEAPSPDCWMAEAASPAWFSTLCHFSSLLLHMLWSSGWLRPDSARRERLFPASLAEGGALPMSPQGGNFHNFFFFPIFFSSSLPLTRSIQGLPASAYPTLGGLRRGGGPRW